MKDYLISKNVGISYIFCLQVSFTFFDEETHSRALFTFAGPQTCGRWSWREGGSRARHDFHRGTRHRWRWRRIMVHTRMTTGNRVHMVNHVCEKEREITTASLIAIQNDYGFSLLCPRYLMNFTWDNTFFCSLRKFICHS